jgi:hypothetical protein
MLLSKEIDCTNSVHGSRHYQSQKNLYHYELFAGIINFKFLNIMVLFSVDLVWGKVNPKANDNCWKKLVGYNFSEHDMLISISRAIYKGCM